MITYMDYYQLPLFTWEIVAGQYVYYGRLEPGEKPPLLWWHQTGAWL